MAAGIVVYKTDAGRREYLLLKRKEGWLDLPKGHLKEGENEYEAAKRETKEETGLEVHPHRFFRYVADYSYEDKGEKINKTATFFVGRAENGNAKASHEHIGLEWLSFDDAIGKIARERGKRTHFVADVIKAAEGYIEKLEKIHEVNREYAKLPSTQREWGLSRTLVPGEGPANASIMFLGQAPGRNEDIERRPFIGMAGKLLDQMIHRAGLNRKEVYITSIVQFFPPENRLPTEEEAALCMPFLEKQIRIIKPKMLVLLGSFSATNVAGIGTVMKTHGTCRHLDKYDCDIFVTLHPAAAVRIKANVPVIEKDFDKLRLILSSDQSRQKALGEF